MNYSIVKTTRALLAAVFISIGSASNSAQADEQKSVRVMPAFSWDKIPRWTFLSVNDTIVTDEEARYIASNFPIAFLFWIPSGPARENQFAEEKILASIKVVKELNPQMKVFYYFNSTLAFDHYAAFREFEKHPDFKMVDKKTGNAVVVRDDVLRYDVTNPKLREWWSEQVAKAVSNSYVDGVWADAVCKIELNKRNVFDKSMNPGDFEKAVSGMHEMLALTKQKIGDGKLLFYNGLRGDLRPGMWEHGGITYLNECDGACVEHFLTHSSRTPDGKLIISHVLKDIELIRKAAAMNKIVVVKAWPKTAMFTDPEFLKLSVEEKQAILRDEITFPLALFLIAAEKNCYFNFSFGYRRSCLPLYHLPEYDKPLGAPLRAAEQEGLILTRDFEHATVWVNLGTEEARIDWK